MSLTLARGSAEVWALHAPSGKIKGSETTDDGLVAATLPAQTEWVAVVGLGPELFTFGLGRVRGSLRLFPLVANHRVSRIGQIELALPAAASSSSLLAVAASPAPGLAFVAWYDGEATSTVMVAVVRVGGSAAGGNTKVDVGPPHSVVYVATPPSALSLVANGTTAALAMDGTVWHVTVDGGSLAVVSAGDEPLVAAAGSGHGFDLGAWPPVAIAAGRSGGVSLVSTALPRIEATADVCMRLGSPPGTAECLHRAMAVVPSASTVVIPAGEVVTGCLPDGIVIGGGRHLGLVGGGSGPFGSL